MSAFAVESKNRIIIFGGATIKNFNVGLSQDYEYDCANDEVISSFRNRVPYSGVFMDKNEVFYEEKVYILALNKRTTVIVYDINKGTWEIATEIITIKK